MKTVVAGKTYRWRYTPSLVKDFIGHKCVSLRGGDISVVEVRLLENVLHFRVGDTVYTSTDALEECDNSQQLDLFE
jgi:hypothetical protein